MLRMRLGLAALTLVALPSVAGAQTQSPLDAAGFRLAYFSPERAYAQSSAGKTAQAKMASWQAEKAKEISARNAKLKELQDTLQRTASVLDETARRQRELEVERFSIDVQRFVEDAKAEFLGVQRDLENAFLFKVRPALDAVAKNRGLHLVFNEDAGMFAWVSPTLDITAEVVKLVDQP